MQDLIERYNIIIHIIIAVSRAPGARIDSRAPGHTVNIHKNMIMHRI